MNNLKTLTLAICFTFVASVASAGVQMGISAHAIMFESTGSETLRQSGNVTNKSVDEDVVVPSIFIEALNSDGIGIGIDYVPVAELGSQSSTNKVDAETNGENKASAELASHSTVYAIAQGANGVFIRLGVSFADVDTTENLLILLFLDKILSISSPVVTGTVDLVMIILNLFIEVLISLATP